MKRHANYWLMAAFVCCLGMSFTSCKEDEDDNKTEEQKEQLILEKSQKFWNVVGQLVSVDAVTEDYEGKTFEPTYGIADATNPTTRIVNTNDMKTAAERFANLVDATGIDENTASYTWKDPEIGTMTYTRGGTAAEWATVDVNIKAVPKLQRIVYRAAGEGENGKFEGKAYYRFGDVVSRQVQITFDQKDNNDNRGTITEYWICVRPAFGPEGKEDSHWVCVNTVGDKNYKYYKASTGTDYWLPYGLKTDKENMQNFAELLWAITNPETWFNNVLNHHKDGKLWGFSGVPFFTDFSGANLSLHNQAFWENVQRAWKDSQIAEKAMNIPYSTLSSTLDSRSGLRLLYKGYSWIFTTSWNCETYEATYTNGSEEKKEELNMHHVEFKTWKKNMKSLKFDIRTMGQDRDNYREYYDKDDIFRWTIRHATGKELSANGSYDPKQPLNGVTEVYRYYRDVLPMNDLSEKPEASETIIKEGTPQVGHLIGMDGKFYPDAAAVQKARTTTAAVVVYVGDRYVENNRQDPTMPRYNGLAMSVDYSSKPFCNPNNPEGICYYQSDYYGNFYNIRNGLKANESFYSGNCKCGNHLGQHVNTHNFNQALQQKNANFSQWFIPSVGQWVMVLRQFGYTWDGTSAQFGNAAEGYERWTEFKTSRKIYTQPQPIMTCTEKSGSEIYTIVMDSKSTRFEARDKKNDQTLVHVFSAFTWGNGPTEDDLLDI